MKWVAARCRIYQSCVHTRAYRRLCDFFLCWCASVGGNAGRPLDVFITHFLLFCGYLIYFYGGSDTYAILVGLFVPYLLFVFNKKNQKTHSMCNKKIGALQAVKICWFFRFQSFNISCTVMQGRRCLVLENWLANDVVVFVGNCTRQFEVCKADYKVKQPSNSPLFFI